MSRIRFTSSNKIGAIIGTVFIIVFFIINTFVPVVMIRLAPQSGVASYFIEHINYIYFSVPLILYFLYTGIFYFKIKIDPYTIFITSKRSITGFFRNSNNLDVAHTMLRGFSFFNRPGTCNKILMLKIETPNKRKLAKRFTLSFLSKKEQVRISEILEKIIAKNL